MRIPTAAHAILPVLALAATAAQAQAPSRLTLGVTGGTLGIGPEIGYDVTPMVGVRASATFLSVSGHGSGSGYRYSGDAHLSSFGGSVDLYPLRSGSGGLRLSAGLRSTEHNRIRFSGRSSTNRVYSGVTYTPDQIGRIDGTIRTKDVAPLLTVGYARRGPGLTFGADAGVMFHGTPRASGFSATGELGTNPNAQADYADQRRRIADEIDAYRYYPVVQVSVGYRF